MPIPRSILPTHAWFLLLLLPGLIPSAFARQPLRAWLTQHIEQRQAQHPPAPPSLPAGSRSELDVAYGSDPKQRYDVYLPPQARPHAPILFMVHGGGWILGDKRMPSVIQNKARYWLQQGYVFISANNRLSPQADPGQQAQDIARAVASVQDNAARWQADPTRLVLMGHSAGAHLVVLLASNPALLQAAGARRPRAAVSLDSGALDIPTLMQQPRLPGFYREAFGTDPAYWRSVSPQQQLSRDPLPMLLVCSSTRQFPTAPCTEAEKFARHAHLLAPDVPVHIRPEARTHEEINDQLGLPSEDTKAVAAWIAQMITPDPPSAPLPSSVQDSPRPPP